MSRTIPTRRARGRLAFIGTVFAIALIGAACISPPPAGWVSRRQVVPACRRPSTRPRPRERCWHSADPLRSVASPLAKADMNRSLAISPVVWDIRGQGFGGGQRDGSGEQGHSFRSLRLADDPKPSRSRLRPVRGFAGSSPPAHLDGSTPR